MYLKKRVGYAVLAIVIMFTAFPAHAGIFGHKASTLDKDHNTAALETYILEEATWASRSEVKDIVAFFNQIAKEQLKLDQDAPLAFIIMKYRGMPLGAVARREGGLLILDLNYRPLPMDQTSLNQALDCDITTDHKRVQLMFRQAEDDGLLKKNDNDRLVMVMDAIIDRLMDEESPFEEAIQIK